MTRCRANRRRAAGGLALAVFIAATPVRAHDATAVVRFADELTAERKYGAAVLEYRRAASFEPALWRDEAYLEKLLNAGFLAGDPEESLALSATVGNKNTSETGACLGALYEGQALYQLERHAAASGSFDRAFDVCSPPFRDRAAYWAGLALYERREWTAGAEKFARVSTDGPWNELARRARAAADDGARLQEKRPRLAGLLSVLIPGSGYLYAGSPGTAAAAFITTGLFAWGTVSAARKDADGAAVVLGLFTAGWYFGGVHGASAAARRYNGRTLKRFIDPFRIH